MKLTKDDPKLTAYALGELSPRESHEVAKAIEDQPDLIEEVENILAFEALFGEKDKLSPKQRAAIFQFGGEADNIVHIPQKSWRLGVVAILGAAAAVIITLTMLQSPAPKGGSDIDTVNWSDWSDTEMLSRVGVNNLAWSSKATVGLDKAKRSTQALKVHASSYRQEMKLRARKSAAVKTASTNLAEKDWVQVSSNSVSRVPLVAGDASFEWVSKSIENGTFPSAVSIREEELLNVNVPQLHPDLIVGGVAGSVEFVRSPWNNDALLAFVRISGDNGAYTQAGVKFSESVKSHRLVGYSDSNSSNSAPKEQQMNHSHLAVYEMQLSGELSDSTEILSLELQVRSGETVESEELHVLYNAPTWDKVVHKDLQHSVLVATWAKWLRSPTDLKLQEILQSQVKSAKTSNESQQKTLVTIKQSLKL